MGGWDWQMQTIIYRMDEQQGPIVWYREPYSIPVVIIVEKSMKKEYIYIYNWIIFAEIENQQKLTQHYNSIICQLKNVAPIDSLKHG